MKNLTQIKGVSRKIAYILWITLFCLPIITIIYWALFNILPASLKMDLPTSIIKDLSFSTRLLAFIVALIPLAIKMTGLWILIKLFHLYQRGNIFTLDNVVCFRQLGITLIVWFLSTPIHIALLSIALTFQNQPGERLIAVGVESSDVTALVTGVMLIVVSWVMDKGRELEDEHQLTI